MLPMSRSCMVFSVSNACLSQFTVSAYSANSGLSIKFNTSNEPPVTVGASLSTLTRMSFIIAERSTGLRRLSSIPELSTTSAYTLDMAASSLSFASAFVVGAPASKPCDI